MDEQPNKRKRIRDPQLTRERLLRAAVDIISEKGADSLSMKEVVRRAEVSRSAAYQHFEDRKHLLKEAKNWIKLRLKNGMLKFDKNATLHERIVYSTHLVLRHPEVTKIMLIDVLSSGNFDLTDPLFRAVNSRMVKSKQLGELRSDLDTEVSTYLHLGGMLATLVLQQQNPQCSNDELAERFASEWCRYLQGGVFPQAASEASTPGNQD